MYDINFKEVKRGRSGYVLAIIIGLIIAGVLIGIYVAGVNKKNRMDSDILSTRVEVREHEDSDGDIMYSPVYYYRVNGVEYKCTVGSSSSIYPSEENKTIYYNSKNPSDCISEYTTKTNFYLLFFTILPAACVVFGVIGLKSNIKTVKMAKILNERGTLYKNVPCRVENPNVEVNGRPMIKVIIDYTLPNGQLFKAEKKMFGGVKDIDGNKVVDLLVDEQDLSIYYIAADINKIN